MNIMPMTLLFIFRYVCICR